MCFFLTKINPQNNICFASQRSFVSSVSLHMCGCYLAGLPNKAVTLSANTDALPLHVFNLSQSSIPIGCSVHSNPLLLRIGFHPSRPQCERFTVFLSPISVASEQRLCLLVFLPVCTRQYLQKNTKMDSIKKKMQAMKIEKENAIDRAEQSENNLRDEQEKNAKVRSYQ